MTEIKGLPLNYQDLTTKRGISVTSETEDLLADRLNATRCFVDSLHRLVVNQLGRGYDKALAGKVREEDGKGGAYILDHDYSMNQFVFFHVPDASKIVAAELGPNMDIDEFIVLDHEEGDVRALTFDMMFLPMGQKLNFQHNQPNLPELEMVDLSKPETYFGDLPVKEMRRWAKMIDEKIAEESE